MRSTVSALSWLRIKSGDQRSRKLVIIFVMAVTIALTPNSARRIGDTVQIALPSLAFVCSIANGQWIEYTGRFVVMEVLLHGSKQGLSDAPINVRPDGGLAGFPSGHTTAAVFGAASLINTCITGSYWLKAALAVSAGFVGSSRISSNRHNIWQVLAGAMLGLITEGAFRSGIRRLISRRRNRKKSSEQPGSQS